MHSNAAPNPSFDGAPSLKGGPHSQKLSSTPAIHPPMHGSDPPYVVKSSPLAPIIAQPPSNLSSFPLPATAPPHSVTPRRPSSAQPPPSASPSPSPSASPSPQSSSQSSIPAPLQTCPCPQFSHGSAISPPAYVPAQSSSVVVPKPYTPSAAVGPPPDPSAPPTPNSSPGPPAQKSPGTIPINPPNPPSETSPPISHLKPSTGRFSPLFSPINPRARHISATDIFGIAVAGFIVVVVVGFIIRYITKKTDQYGHYHGPYLGSLSCRSGGMYATKRAPWPSGEYPSRSVTLSLPPSGSEAAYNGLNGSVGGCAFGVSRSINTSRGPRMGNWKSQFTFEELMVATNGFSRENLLGVGSFGCVYKGCMQDGQAVAVKKLKLEALQGEHEFRAEVEIIGRVHHRHLVSLVGYCIADSQWLLVNEYVPNGTLEHHLHEKEKFVMDWATRLKIAIGAARGLAYLHEDCHPQIIHRDIKSSNILLDNNFEAQVSDFGLAKISPDTNTRVTTYVTGTLGYMAPEYASTGKPSEKSDVYSFGVLLLELVTGKRPVDTSQPVGNWSLVKWAQPLLNHALEDGNFEGLVDPKLENNFRGDEMLCMVKVAAACICYLAQSRPRMGQVVRELENDVDSFDLNNGVKPGESAQYDPAFIQTFHMMAFGNQEYECDCWEETSDYGLSAYA